MAFYLKMESFFKLFTKKIIAAQNFLWKLFYSKKYIYFLKNCLGFLMTYAMNMIHEILQFTRSE